MTFMCLFKLCWGHGGQRSQIVKNINNKDNTKKHNSCQNGFACTGNSYRIRPGVLLSYLGPHSGHKTEGREGFV